jgi:hypothetical protein
MVRFYLVPVEVSPGFTGPKYFPYRGDPDPPALVQVGDDGQSIRKESRTYGAEPSMLIAANTTDADDATLAAMPDVTKFADNLDTPLGARLGAMQTALEGLNLPAQMLKTRAAGGAGGNAGRNGLSSASVRAVYWGCRCAFWFVDAAERGHDRQQKWLRYRCLLSGSAGIRVLECRCVRP